MPGRDTPIAATHRAGTLSAVIGSAIVHVVLIAVLSFILLPLPQPESLHVVQTTFSDPADKPPALLQIENEKPVEQMELHASQSFLTSVDTSPATAKPFNESVALHREMSFTGLPTASLGEGVEALVEVAGASPVVGPPGGKPGEPSFFGIDLKDEDAVFVVDGSLSMNYPHPGPAKTRFGRVKLELLKTITNMSEEQKFFMIFFNQNAVPMPAERMMEATAGSQKRYLTWMTQLKAAGQTNPEQALLLALYLKPDVIYFLTDGDFDYKVVPSVTQANQANIRIHTIGFGDDRGEKFLKEIAKFNDGTYRFVPAPGIPTSKSIMTQLKMKRSAQ